MKRVRGVVHLNLRCKDCGKEWSDYLGDQKRAYNHAIKHKHFVTGEIGYMIEYDGRKEKRHEN